MDIGFIIAFAPLYAKSLLLVLKLCFWGTLFSVFIGLLCALSSYFRVTVLRHIAACYIEVSRNTPLMIQLFFLYFGLSRMGIKLASWDCAVIGLSFLGGSYMAESFRGGLEAVGRAQIESGLSIGLSPIQLVRYVVLPQALAVSTPVLGANVIFLLKETSVVSIVALADLMFTAKDLIGIYYKTNEALAMLVLAYLAALLPLSLLLRFVERRLRFAGFGH